MKNFSVSQTKLNEKVRQSVMLKMTDFAKLIGEIRKQTEGSEEFQAVREELERTKGFNEAIKLK